MTYKLVEIFESIQGEGLQSGRLATFIRLAGCNLRCPWCDTPESFQTDGRETLELNKLLDLIEKFSHSSFLVITGGEPLLQDLPTLIENLSKKGFEIAIETNGTLPLSKMVDWLTVSPKPPLYQIHPELLGKISELKLVVDDNLSYFRARELWNLVGNNVPLILQPESCRSEMMEKILDWLEKEPRWRLGIQLHKVIGVR